MKNRYVGSSLNEFLAEEDRLAESELKAIKRLIALELQQALKKHIFTKTALANKIGTSRVALDRLLNPENTSVTLNTLDRAARAIGKKLHLSLV